MWFFAIKNMWLISIITVYAFLSNCFRLVCMEKRYLDENNRIKSTKLKNVYLVKNIEIKNNAFCCFNNIFLEENLYNELINNSISLNTVIFHEQYHLKKHHLLFKLILKYLVVFLIFTCTIFSGKYLFLLVVFATLFYVYSLSCEYKADQYALNYCSKEDMVKMLKIACRKPKKSNKIDFFDFHPALEKRIKRLK